jgi:hypothetical protein
MIAIAMISFAAVFMIKEKIETKANQISERRIMLVAMEKNEDNFLQIKESYKIVQNDLPVIKQYFPDEDNIDSFVDNIQSLAEKSGGKQILKFEPLNKSAIEGINLRKLTLSSTVYGNTGIFIKYLQGIQNMPYFIRIDRIEIKNAVGTSDINGQMFIEASLFIKK